MKNFAYYVDGALSKLICFFMGAAIAGYYVRGLIALFAFALTFSLCVSELYMHVLYGRKPKKDKRNSAIIPTATLSIISPRLLRKNGRSGARTNSSAWAKSLSFAG